MRKPPAPSLACLAVLAACVPGAHPIQAQSAFFVRLAPEVSLLAVEHTKKVTIGGGSSSSTSSSSGVGAALVLAGGFHSSPPGGWGFGAELEAVLPSRHLIEGTIDPTDTGNPHDVWPGRWEFKHRFGMGGGLLAGRSLGHGEGRIYLLVGLRWSWGEFATGGTNPDTGIAGEDRARLGHWPATVGVGMTLAGRWPVDARLRYFRSAVDWVISQPDLGLDYAYVVGGLALSVGIGRGSDR